MRQSKLFRIESLEIKAAWIYFAARLILILSLPLDGITSYGDLWNFFSQAELGLPFINYWTEFPPIYPWISRLLYQIAVGAQHRFDYLNILFFSFLQSLNLFLLLKISDQVGRSQSQKLIGGAVYGGLTIGLFYTWAYFDVIAVAALLASIYFLFDDKPHKVGILIAGGVLTKWFPLALIPGIWKTKNWRTSLKISITGIGIAILVWAGLFLINPEMTSASIQSQAVKGSWETVWALLDGNLNTGNFPKEVNRLDPGSINLSSNNPSLIPSWITLIVFGGAGLILLMQSKINTRKKYLAFSGLTFVIMFLWSPGYSPQWVQYLLPIIILAIPAKQSVLVSATLILINLAEWPLLLSRGRFEDLYWLIPVRTLVLILLGIIFYQQTIEDPAIAGGVD